MNRVSQLDREELSDVLQEIANTEAEIITVVWKGGRHEVFTRKEHQNGQLTLDGMSMPEVRKLCQKLEPGE